MQPAAMSDEVIRVEIPRPYGPGYAVPKAMFAPRADGTDLIVLQPRGVYGWGDEFLWRAPDIFGPLLVVTLVALLWRISRMWFRSQPAGKPCCARCGYQLGTPQIAVRRQRSDPVVAERGAACPECGVLLGDVCPIIGKSFMRRVMVPLLVGMPLVAVYVTMLAISLEWHKTGFGQATWPVPDLESVTRWVVQRRRPVSIETVTDVSCHSIETGSRRWRINGLPAESPHDAQIVAERYLVMVCENDPDSPYRVKGVEARRDESGRFGYVLMVIDLKYGSMRNLALDASAGGAWSMVDGPGQRAIARMQRFGHTLKQPAPTEPGANALEYFLELHEVDCETLTIREVVREPVETRATLPGGGFLVPYSSFLVPRDSDGSKYAVFFGHQQLQGGTTIAGEGQMLMVDGERRSLQRFIVSGMGWMAPSLSPEQDQAEFVSFGASYARGSVDWDGLVRHKPPGVMPIESHVVSSRVEPGEVGPRFHAEPADGIYAMTQVYLRSEVVAAWNTVNWNQPAKPVMPEPWATTTLSGTPQAVSDDGLLVAGIRDERVEGKKYWQAAYDDVRVVVVRATQVRDVEPAVK